MMGSIHLMVSCTEVKAELLNIACCLDADEVYSREKAVTALKKVIEDVHRLEGLFIKIKEVYLFYENHNDSK
jgi:hypothetical protein